MNNLRMLFITVSIVGLICGIILIISGIVLKRMFYISLGGLYVTINGFCLLELLVK